MTTEAYPPPAHTAPRGQCPSSPPLVRRPSPSAACHRPPPVHVSCALASTAASGLVLAGSGGSILYPPDLVVRPRPPPVLVPACFISVHRPSLSLRVVVARPRPPTPPRRPSSSAAQPCSLRPPVRAPGARPCRRPVLSCHPTRLRPLPACPQLRLSCSRPPPVLD